MRYVPYHELGRTPNIIVDGAAQQATLLTLSHWPRSGTPEALKADLSAQIVFNYLARSQFHVSAEAVSNNHFDEDGLVSLYSMLHPEAAERNQELLIDIAAAGDFGTYRFRESVRTVFVLSAFASEETSPFHSDIFKGSYPEKTSALYQEMLPRLTDICFDLNAYREFWSDEDEKLATSERAIQDGSIRIEELPDVDLAVITLPDGFGDCHPIALHNATGCFRLLTLAGKKYELKFRYETWVQYMSRRPMPRVDLTPLAEQFSSEDGASWQFDGVEEIVPRLYRADEQESRITPETFRRKVIDFLASAPPAWNPFDSD